ncbi:MAG: ribonuclease D [Anderseniella sp.]|jgi:ribonuclease D|nr:ribonuclease D [Anderseniella sp.]
MQIITTTPALSALCERLSSEDFVTVDTEFMREHTFWPILCLIQIAGETEEAIIDPMAKGLDLAPFYQLMANEAVLKVFHAARQDVEIFVAATGETPKPLFDTQVAAMVCGFGDQVGYEALVRKLAGEQIDKSSRFTDWSRRPLSDKQLKYALSDVTHLRVVYEKLDAMLRESGRASWLSEEMAIIASADTYKSNPDEAWKRLKFRPRNARQLGIAIAVSRWREERAQTKNMPRQRIIKDDAIIEVATQAPADKAALSKLRALPKGLAEGGLGDEILKAIQAGMAIDKDSLPELEPHKGPQPEGASAIAEILKLGLKVIAERENIAPRLIANAAELEEMAGNGGEHLPMMQGWRRELFGNIAAGLKQGKLMIGIRDGKPDIFEG